MGKVMALVVAVVLATAVPADAATRTTFTKVVGAREGSTLVKIFGGIRNANPACLSRRLVGAVYSTDGGNTVHTYGADRTNSRGKFAIKGSAPDDAVYGVQVFKRGSCGSRFVTGTFF